MRTKRLLTKVAWNYKDIMAYCDCGKDKAYHYMDIARKVFNGGLRYEPTMVKIDSVLEIFETNREQELRLLGKGGKDSEEKL